MDYQSIYNRIIFRAQQRVEPNEKYEKHHIVPRSMNGSNDENNIVKLTLREHFICHLLLAKLHGGSMLWAFQMMSKTRHIKSPMYEVLKKNIKHTEETKEKMRKPKSEEHKRKMRKAKSPEQLEKMRNISEETREKLRNTHLGKKKSVEQIENMKKGWEKRKKARS